MEEYENIVTRWEKRDVKQRAKKRFSSDNRRSIRWLYLKSGQKLIKEKSNEDTSSDMFRM
jgi:hypothetical protein